MEKDIDEDPVEVDEYKSDKFDDDEVTVKESN